MTVRFAILVILLVFAIPLHELGHALAAHYSGDEIPSLQGRLTPEPWAHWDLLGSVLIAFGVFTGAAVIGWGKPVITDPASYRNGRRGMFLVAIAGVLVNILLALIGAGIYRGLQAIPHPDAVFSEICRYFVLANVSLALFNLLPAPPLDGYKVILSLCSPATAIRLARKLDGIGMVVLFILVWQFGRILWAPINACATFLLGA